LKVDIDVRDINIVYLSTSNKDSDHGIEH